MPSEGHCEECDVDKIPNKFLECNLKFFFHTSYLLLLRNSFFLVFAEWLWNIWQPELSCSHKISTPNKGTLYMLIIFSVQLKYNWPIRISNQNSITGNRRIQHSPCIQPAQHLPKSKVHKLIWHCRILVSYLIRNNNFWTSAESSTYY